MTIQEAIKRLEEIKKEHGNIKLGHISSDFEIVMSKSINIGCFCGKADNCIKDDACEKNNYCGNQKIAIVMTDED